MARRHSATIALHGPTCTAFCLFAITAGCDVWKPPVPTARELDRGLVVLYPGSFNTVFEMIGFYYGLREGGIDQAIEVVQWAGFMDHAFDPVGAQVRNDQRATEEAARIAAYQLAHPESPVTVVGYSAGCWFSVLVAERMPQGAMIDRVILMNASIKRSYDLSAAMRGADEIVHFWSPGDQFTWDMAQLSNLADSSRDEPAATFSFDMLSERLMQVKWTPEWDRYGHHGNHGDYLFLVDWIAEFVAPWVPVR